MKSQTGSGGFSSHSPDSLGSEAARVTEFPAVPPNLLKQCAEVCVRECEWVKV